MLKSTARVVTERPERYIKQLVNHLGNRVETRLSDDGAGQVTTPSGTCVLVPEAGAIVLSAQAGDAEGLARLQDVVGRHLMRFGEKAELVVKWDDSVA